MTDILKVFSFLLLVFLTLSNAAAQKKDRVETSPTAFITADKECADVKLGKTINVPKIAYPAEAKLARVGGTVFVTVKIDDKGAVSEVEKTVGNQSLQTTAADGAKKIRFSPTVCDGATTPATAVLTFNFIPFISNSSYFTPTKSEDLTDIKKDSPYFEAVSSLAENYKLAFGYADKKFYADAPLTRGDFAQFLRLTLDLLSERAQTANKLPREINLFFPYNPQKLTSINAFGDLKSNVPYYDSVKSLLLKYDIAFTDAGNMFHGSEYITNNELIDWWTKVFGEDAIPINFERAQNGDPIVTRGEFALFLEESLQVLTYKVLPDSSKNFVLKSQR